MNTKKRSLFHPDEGKGIFLKVGLSVAMAFVLMAFQYKITERVSPELPTLPDLLVETEMIEITIPKPPPPPPPPDVQEIIIAPSDIEIDEADLFIDVEAHADIAVPDFSIADLTHDEEPVPDQEIFFRAEVMPEFPGGEQAMFAYLGRTINYPRIALEYGIEGTVIVGFVIERDGSVSNVEVLRGMGHGLDEEAVRAIKSMPAWNPGRMGTQPVRVRYTVPVVFRIRR